MPLRLEHVVETAFYELPIPVELKENIRVEGKRNIQTKVMTTLFALFAEVERDLTSERTREGLARARASGARRAR